MTARSARRLAWAVGCLILILIVVSLVYLALDTKAIDSPFTAQVIWFLNAVVVGGFGVLIASRRPRNVIGWLMLVIALFNAVDLAADFISIRALLTGATPTESGVEWAAWVFNWSAGLGAFLLAFLIFVFPDGRLPSPRWRWVARSAVAVGCLLTAGSMLSTDQVQLSPRLPNIPSPIGVSAVSGLFNGFGSVLQVVLLMLPIAAVVVRLRRATGFERQQLAWFAYVAFAAIGVTITGFALSIVDAGVGTAVSGAAFDLGIGVLIPATIGLSVVKHRLYDIDIVISRTLVFGALALFITAVYVAIAVGIGALVGGGGKPNLGLSILATAIVAVGFQPLRERLQKVANRLVYGKRATPYEVLSEFSERVAGSYAMDEVLPRMARVLADATGAQRADVWLSTGASLSPAATWPEDAEPHVPVALSEGRVPAVEGIDRIVVVRHQDDVLGALSVSRRAGESLTPVEENLLIHLANQAGLVLKNVGLTAQLQSRLEALRASRQRLVAAQDEERRRLERNLHDGAQQHLVAIKVKLGIAEILLKRDREKARATLQQLKSDADEALSTLRDLARGIYPPLLADRGLVAALESHARKATVAVTVTADGVGRYSQEVEAAVYFCCLEALQNVQKYAGATAVTVALATAGKALRFTVADDGRGFDTAAVLRGSGLTNMEDRLVAFGGRLAITSILGGGTTLCGELPADAGTHAQPSTPERRPMEAAQAEGAKGSVLLTATTARARPAAGAAD